MHIWFNPDPRWGGTDLAALAGIPASAFEVVEIPRYVRYALVNAGAIHPGDLVELDLTHDPCVANGWPFDDPPEVWAFEFYTYISTDGGATWGAIYPDFSTDGGQTWSHAASSKLVFGTSPTRVRFPGYADGARTLGPGTYTFALASGGSYDFQTPTEASFTVTAPGGVSFHPGRIAPGSTIGTGVY
jgi:hypothetical protein